MIGLKIKEFILSKGLKFKAIATKARIPENVFSMMINGKRKISTEEYFSICDALGVSVETFKDEKASA